MKNSPEYYEFLEQTNETIKMMTIKVNLKEKVDVAMLQNSVQKAIQRYPYLAVRIIRKGTEDMELVHNDAPVSVLKRGAEKVIFGSEQTNGHFLTLQYEENTIYFTCLHALSGPSGINEFVKTTLYVYLSERYGRKLGTGNVHLPDSDMEEGERTYFSYEQLNEEDSFLNQSSDQECCAMNWGAFSRQLYYEIKIPTENFVREFKTSEGSPTSAVSILMYKALKRYLGEGDETIVAGIAHEYSAAVGCENSTQNMVRTIYAKYPKKVREYDDDLLTTITRGQLILQTQKEKSVAIAKAILDNHCEIDKLSTLQEKQEYALSHTQYGDAVVPAYCISCSGAFELEGMDTYVDSVYAIITVPLGAEVYVNQKESFICLMLTDQNESFLQAFLDELKTDNIPYEVKGPFDNEIMGITY